LITILPAFAKTDVYCKKMKLYLPQRAAQRSRSGNSL